MRYRNLRIPIYFCVWMGLNILWALRAISYPTVESTMLVGKGMVLNFVPLAGITVLLLMTLFKWRPINLIALIFLILATITAKPPIYLLPVAMFGVVFVLICDAYLAVIICNHDRPAKYVNQIAVIIGVLFCLCLLSPKLSAHLASSSYADPFAAAKTEIVLTDSNVNQLKKNKLTIVTPKQPRISIKGIGNISFKIRRFGIFYVSYADYKYHWKI